MYFDDLTNEELQLYHNLFKFFGFTVSLYDMEKNSLFKVIQISDNLYKIFPLFYVDSISCTNDNVKILNNKCILLLEDGKKYGGSELFDIFDDEGLIGYSTYNSFYDIFSYTEDYGDSDLDYIFVDNDEWFINFKLRSLYDNVSSGYNFDVNIGNPMNENKYISISNWGTGTYIYIEDDGNYREFELENLDLTEFNEFKINYLNGELKIIVNNIEIVNTKINGLKCKFNFNNNDYHNSIDIKNLIISSNLQQTYIDFNNNETDINNNKIKEYMYDYSLNDNDKGGKLVSNYKHDVGDKFTINDYNQLVQIIRDNIVLYGDITIKDGLSSGQYADYIFDLKNTTIIDSGVLISQETIDNGIGVTLSNPKFNYSNYILRLEIQNIKDTNISGLVTDSKDANIENKTIEVPLVPYEEVQIPLENIEAGSVILFTTNVEINHNKPYVLYVDRLTLNAPTSAYTTQTINMNLNFNKSGTPYQNTRIDILNYDTGDLLGYTTTDSNGDATFNYRLMEEGFLKIVAKPHDMEDVQSNIILCNVSICPTTMTLNTSVACNYIVDTNINENIIFINNLTNTPMANVPLDLYFDDNKFTTVTTDSNGRYTYNHNSVLGNHTFSVKYNGGKTYQSQTKYLNYTGINKKNLEFSIIKNSKTKFSIKCYDNGIKYKYPYDVTVKIGIGGNTTTQTIRLDDNGEYVYDVGTAINGYTVEVSIPNDCYYNAVTETATFDKIGINIIQNEGEEVYANQNINFVATLTDEDELPLSEKTLYIYDHNSSTVFANGHESASLIYSGNTNNNGQINTTIYFAKAGKGRVYVQFKGDNVYSSGQTNYVEYNVVKRDTEITYNTAPESAYVGNNVVVKALIKDLTNNTGINGITLDLYKNGVKISSATTDSSGVATFTGFTKNKSGTESYYVKFSGNDAYNESQADDVEITFIKQNTSITYTSAPTSAYIDDNVTVSAKLVNGSNVAISGKILTLEKDNGIEENVQTNSSGIATFTPFTSNTNTTIGYKVTFNGDDAYNNSDGENKYVTFSRKSTTLTYSSAPTSVYTNASFNISVVLKDGDGNVISNKNVSLSMDGGTYYATTNGSGVATFSNFNYSEPKTISYYVIYNGESGYAPCQSSAKTLVISKRTPTLTYSSAPTSAYVDNNYTISATLKNESGSVMANKTVYMFKDNSYLDQTITNSSGVASFTYKENDIASYNYYLRYDGDANYNGVNTANKNINVIRYTTRLVPYASASQGSSMFYQGKTSYYIDDSKPHIFLAIAKSNNDNDRVSDAGSIKILKDGNIAHTVNVSNTDMYSQVLDIDMKQNKTYSIKAQYDGSNKYNSSNKTETISVNKYNTSFTDVEIYRTSSNYIQFGAKLKNTSNNTYLSGQTVSLLRNNSVINTATTNSNGWFDMAIPIDTSQNNVAKIRYDGTYKYNSSNSSEKTIYRTYFDYNGIIMENIVINDNHWYNNTGGGMGAYLVKQGGTALSGKTLYLDVYCNGSKVFNGSATTNSSGLALIPFDFYCSLTLPKDIYVYYNGDSDYMSYTYHVHIDGRGNQTQEPIELIVG